MFESVCHSLLTRQFWCYCSSGAAKMIPFCCWYHVVILLDNNSFGSKSVYSFWGSLPAWTFNCWRMEMMVVLLQSWRGYKKLNLVLQSTITKVNFISPWSHGVPILNIHMGGMKKCWGLGTCSVLCLFLVNAVKLPCPRGISPACVKVTLFLETDLNTFTSLRVRNPKYLCMLMLVIFHFVWLFGLGFSLGKDTGRSRIEVYLLEEMLPSRDDQWIFRSHHCTEVVKISMSNSSCILKAIFGNCSVE